MKRIIAIGISILLFVPSFVYGEGGNEMTQYNNYQSGSMTDLNKVPGGVTYTNSDGKKRRWDAKSGAVYDSQLYDLQQAQLRSQINALDNSRNSALSNLNSEQSTLADTYYNKRNRAAAQSDVGALNFAQFMAGRGVSGNAGVLPEIYRNNALQGQIGALDQQEASENAQIEANKAAVNNAYENDVAAARSNSQAALLQATIDQQNADKIAALEQQRYDAEQSQKADMLTYNRLQDTKNEYANTISRYSDDYQAQINKVLNDNDPSNDWQVNYLAAARVKKIEDQKAQESAAQIAEQKAAQQQFENDLKTKQYQLDAAKTNYDISKPYSSGGGSELTANQQLNQANNSKVSQMTNWIYNVPTKAEAMTRLTQNKAMILQQLMEAGYDGSSALKYWNDMYADLGGL